MIKSMTGFGSKEAEISPFGKVSVELRSTNHKFLEAVFHLPEGFLVLEDRIKKELETKIKRGRVTCAINISGEGAQRVFINKKLLKDYIASLRNIKSRFHLQGEINLDTLIRLPGVLSLAESILAKARIWPRLKILIRQALDELAATRQKEGRALQAYLKNRAQFLTQDLTNVKTRFKKVMRDKAAALESDEERASFLKDADISEELERLAFHSKNFQGRLSKAGPMGKELDFIAQEMQREANTIGAKSCDAAISGKVVRLKSQVEKIREQAQNVE